MPKDPLYLHSPGLYREVANATHAKNFLHVTRNPYGFVAKHPGAFPPLYFLHVSPSKRVYIKKYDESAKSRELYLKLLGVSDIQIVYYGMWQVRFLSEGGAIFEQEETFNTEAEAYAWCKENGILYEQANTMV